MTSCFAAASSVAQDENMSVGLDLCDGERIATYSAFSGTQSYANRKLTLTAHEKETHMGSLPCPQIEPHTNQPHRSLAPTTSPALRRPRKQDKGRGSPKHTTY
jgi:hypothetical protein